MDYVLHPATTAWFEHRSECHQPHGDVLHYYTDGSASIDKDNAAWAFAVYRGHPNQDETDFDFMGWLSAKVVVASDDPQFIGALQLDSASAEATGLWWAVLHAYTQLSSMPAPSKFVFHFDSTSIGWAMEGTFNTKLDIVGNLRMLMQGLEALVGPTLAECCHVKAHTGHPHNELVNSLAQCALLRACDVTLNLDFRFLLDNDKFALRWIWLLARHRHQAHCLPELRHQGLLLPPRAHLHGSQQPQDWTFGYGRDSIASAEPFAFNAAILSFNVRTLQDKDNPVYMMPGRMLLLEGQAIDLQLAILGLQETRSRTSQTARSGYYYKYRAAAAHGKGGLELWISTTLPLVTFSGISFKFDPSTAVILHSDAELMLLKWVPCRGIAFLLVNGHAPHKGHEDSVKHQWWLNLTALLERHAANCFPIFMLDANAALGTPADAYVGNLDAEIEDVNGCFLHALLEKFNMWLPSTFPDAHTGPSATWFSSATNRPQGLRLDYIAVPMQWRTCTIASTTLPDLDVGQGTIDHIAVLLEIKHTTSLRRRRFPPVRPHHKVDWQAVRRCRDRNLWNQVFSGLPQPEWTEDVHQHWQSCHHALTASLAHHFPKKKSVPKKPYIDAETWQWRNQKQALRRQVALRVQLCKHLDEAACWHVWKGAISLRKAFLNSLLWALRCQAAHLKDKAALQQANQHLRTALKRQRSAFLIDLAHEAEQAPSDQIYAKLKKAGFCSNRRLRDRPLPQIEGPDGHSVGTPDDLRECWRQHFAKIESGRKVHPDTLHQLCIYTELVSYRCPDENILRSLPTLRDLEASFRRCKPQRASGPDMIPPELCHFAARWMTHYLAPLYLKCALYQAEPIQWKGGVLHEVYKRKGSMQAPGSYRGILVSSHLAKCLHNVFRAPTLRWHADSADPLQYGGLPGRGVDQASHTLRLFLSLARQAKSSCGVFFLDIASAYYRLLRTLAVGPTCTQAELLEVFRSMDLPKDIVYELATAAFSPDALQETGCPDWLRQFGKIFHQHTWFHVRDGSAVTETLRGTRPGDGYADLLFNLVIGRVLRQLEHELQSQGLQTTYTWDGSRNFAAQPGSEATASGLNVVWADDIAVMVHHETGDGLIEALQLVFGSYIDRLAAHGLALNFGTGKTEALVLIRGKGACGLRQRLFRDQAGTIAVETVSAGCVPIRLVHRYKHLGVQIHANGSLLPELRVRVGCANTAFNRHRRAIYQNIDLSIEKRLQLFRACVMSVLLWNGGTWPPLHDKEYKYIHGAFRRLLLRLLYRDFPVDTLQTWSDLRLLGYVGILGIPEQLRLLRLGYYGRLFLEGPRPLWALLANEGIWLAQIKPDFEWLYRNCQSLVFRPDPLSDEGFDYWHDLIRTRTSSWKGLLRKAQAHARLQLCVHSEVDVFHRDFALTLRNHDPSLQPTPCQEVVAEDHVFPCIPCGRSFATKQGWAIHCFRAHGRRAPARYLVDQETCACCLRTYLNPSRLYLHLRTSRPCFDFLRARGVHADPLPGRGSRAWNNEEQFTFLPPQQAAGPSLDLPFMPEPQASLSPHELDLLTALMDLEALPHCDPLQADAGSATIDVIKDCLRCWPASLEEMRQVLVIWDELLRAEHAGHRRILPLVTAHWCRSIAQVQEALCLRWLCPELLDLDPLCHSEYTPAERLRHIPADAFKALPSPPRTLSTARPIFVHLFSGRRREQDVQWYMENIDWDGLPTPLVVSLDVMIDKETGNCLNPANRLFWLRAMQDGYIAGILAGPPCESWSISRERWWTEHRGPRPLRSASSPWALASLLLRELRQVYVANGLLHFSVAAFLIMALLGRFAMLEHPAPPDQEQHPQAPTIWRLSPLEALTKLPGVRRNHIYQGYHGAKSPKPTSLLVSHGPDLEPFSKPFRVRSTLPPPLKMGRIEGGEYATASLKEYPPSLNELIAHAFKFWLTEAVQSRPDPPAPIPPDVMDAFMRLHVTVYTDHYGPDYACN
eukprot:Skav224814  [mRNA]  locus=scaffold21:91531:97434:- [translate_table: standard]